jgi:hypothetical protein
MAASDYVPISFKNRLHLAGRPQMSSRPSRPSGSRHRAMLRLSLFTGPSMMRPSWRLARVSAICRSRLDPGMQTRARWPPQRGRAIAASRTVFVSYVM